MYPTPIARASDDDPTRIAVKSVRGVAPRQTAAFTIVEMVVVLLILGVLAAAAIPTFYQSLMYHRLEGAARRVKLDLQQLQQTARTKSTAQTMTFAGATYTLSAGVQGLDRPSGSYVVNLAASPYQVDSVAVNFGGPTAISFDGYGNPSVGGTIALSLNGKGRTITIDGNTGNVTLAAN